MIRLWHPMRDPHHCSYRMLTLLMKAPDNQIQIPKLSFLDLFFLFPHYLRDIKVTSDAVPRKQNLKLPNKKDSFVYLPDVRLVYRELQQFQRVAIDRLVARNILLLDEYSNQFAKLNPSLIPVELASKITTSIGAHSELLDYLIGDIGSMPIDGPNSLLRQTKLELGGRL